MSVANSAALGGASIPSQAQHLTQLRQSAPGVAATDTGAAKPGGSLLASEPAPAKPVTLSPPPRRPPDQVQIQNDNVALGTALQSGDVAGALKAYATLQQDMQDMQTAKQAADSQRGAAEAKPHADHDAVDVNA